MIIIDAQQKYRLDKVYSNASLLSSEHLTDLKNEKTRYVYEEYYKHLDNPMLKLNVLNMSSGLSSVVSDAYTAGIGQPESGLFVDMQETVESLLLGYFVWVLSIEDSQPKVAVIDAERFYKEDGNDVILSFYQKYKDNDLKKYILKEVYNPNTISVTRTLFLVDNILRGAVEGSTVPLDTIYETKHLFDEEVFPFYPIIFGKYGNKEYGRSELGRIASKVYSYDINMVNVGDQLNKHLSAKLSMPMTTAKDIMRFNNSKSLGGYDTKGMEVMLTEAGDTKPEYVLNTNPHMIYAFDYLLNLKKLISAESKVPLSFFGEDVSAGQSGESKRRDIVLFNAKVQVFQTIIKKAYEQAFELFSSLLKEEERQVVFPQLYTKEDKERLDEAVIAKESGLISHVKAIALYQNVSEEMALEELQLIRQETADVDINFN